MDHSTMLLVKGDDVWQDSTVKKKLDEEILTAVLGVLLDDREKERLVSQVLGPEGVYSQPGGGQIFTVTQDV